MLGILIYFCLSTSVYGLGGADVVLSCSLIEEGGGMGGGMGGGALFTRTPATLVLRDLAVTSDSDLSPDTVTPYNPPETPDPNDIIFEVKESSVEIPDADSLLHADCNEQEVTCEISRYVPRGAEPDATPAFFIGSLQLEGGGISFTLVLQTLSNEKAESEAPPLMQRKLELPLSQSGTLLTKVVFLVFSRSQFFAAPLGGDAVLDCGFRQQDTPPEQEVGLEWRLQHRGTGRKVLEMRAVGVETEEGPEVLVQQAGASADAALLVREGNASLTLTEVRVSDEGTYICTVTSGLFQTQQVIQLHITQPPTVSLSEEKLIFQDDSPQKLSCYCRRYYPLDVQVEWFSLAPSETEPISLSQHASLSSHSQHSDGTFSLSAHLMLRRSAHPPGTTLTCRVSHQDLDTPIDVSVTVQTPEPEESYWMIIVILVMTVLFYYQVLR